VGVSNGNHRCPCLIVGRDKLGKDLATMAGRDGVIAAVSAPRDHHQPCSAGSCDMAGY
jgi:hypothetical protein